MANMIRPISTDACETLLIGFTALGVGVEHVVLDNQNLAIPFPEK